MTLFTEFTSNTSSASIFLPILAQLVREENLYYYICITRCQGHL